MRNSLFGVISATFDSKLVILYLYMSAYTVLIVYVLFSFGLWDLSQLKNTILWTLTVGSVSLFDAAKREKINYFKKALNDVLKLTTITEFVIGLYPFRLWVELLIIPVSFALVLLVVFSEKVERLRPIGKVLNGILIFLGLFLIAYAIYMISKNFPAFATTGTLSDFLIPPTLSFLFLPFVYLLSLYVAYEGAFAGLSNIIPNKALEKYAKKQAVLRFNFNKHNPGRWRMALFLNPATTKLEIDQSISKIKQLNKIEREPPDVAFNFGWSPYKAKEFLANAGLPTGYYKDIGEGEWFACSPYLDLKDSEIISNNLSYYVEGDEQKATRLKLNLNINAPDAAITAHQKLVENASILYQVALNKRIPVKSITAIMVGKELKTTEGNRTISIYKNDWPNHKLKGYNVKFTIEIHPLTTK